MRPTVCNNILISTLPEASWVYGMLVHSCYVDDGAGNKVQLIDSQGCPVDIHLVPAIVYDDKHLRA